ncbi:MAG: aa3-type cytochrome c oxidase subunit IV [Kiloniellales bacterium]
MAEDQLLEEHRRTWQSFVKLVTVSTALVVVTLLLMALFLL